MTNQELQTFLNIIDGRIKKYINENKLLKQYCGVITGEVLESLYKKYKVKILGNETEFIFLNKTGEPLAVGDNVFIQTMGTDLNTGVITYKAKESTIDYIIEQGTSGIWTYRKWNSGIAECWGFQQITVNGWNAYGNLYRSDETVPEIDYPFSFTEVPTLIVDCYNYGWLRAVSSADRTTTVPEQRIFRETTSTKANITINYCARGKWK